MVSYKISEEAAARLADLVSEAYTALDESINGTAKLVADIYTGRDPSAGARSIVLGDQGLPYDQYVEATDNRKSISFSYTADCHGFDPRRSFFRCKGYGSWRI